MKGSKPSVPAISKAEIASFNKQLGKAVMGARFSAKAAGGQGVEFEAVKIRAEGIWMLIPSASPFVPTQLLEGLARGEARPRDVMAAQLSRSPNAASDKELVNDDSVLRITGRIRLRAIKSCRASLLLIAVLPGGKTLPIPLAEMPKLVAPNPE